MAKPHRPTVNDASVRVRLPSDLKEAGDEILRVEGLSQSQAVRMLYIEMVRLGRYPWEIKTVDKPNASDDAGNDN